MTWTRVCFIAVLIGSLATASARATTSATSRDVAVPCNATAMSGPFTGPLRVRSVQNFGCVGSWGFLWATVGRGVTEVSVTEVVHFNDARGRWNVASRLKDCGHGVLPGYVQYWGCNSN